MKASVWKIGLCTFVLGLIGLAATPSLVEAGALKAQVYLCQRKIPKGLTERGLLGFMRKNNAKRLQETNEENMKERKFKAEMVTAFNRPVGDLEFHVLFYDVHDGPRIFIEDMSTFISDRTQKVFLQRIKLPRERFKPNRRMEMVVTVKRQEVGKHKFMTQGEKFQHSGKVDFADEDT